MCVADSAAALRVRSRFVRGLDTPVWHGWTSSARRRIGGPWPCGGDGRAGWRLTHKIGPDPVGSAAKQGDGDALKRRRNSDSSHYRMK